MSSILIHFRAVIASLLIIVIGAAAAGIPVFPLVKKDHSAPYPCQSCACACADAETCWRKCCCMTDREKLAWAAAHGVEPPAFLVARVRDAETLGARDHSGGSCCHRSVESRDAGDRDAGDRGLATQHPSSCWVLYSAQARCQALQTYMLLLAMSLPVPVCCHPDLPTLVTWNLQPIDAKPLGCLLPPPLPPPQWWLS